MFRKRWLRRTTAASMTLWLGLIAGGSEGGVIQYTYTANKILHNGLPNTGTLNDKLINQDIQTITGTISFDTSAPTLGPGLGFDTGTFTVDQANSPLTRSGGLMITDNAVPLGDTFSQTYSQSGPQVVALNLRDFNATSWSSSALPTSLNLSQFETRELLFDDQERFNENVVLVHSQIIYEITELTRVPEPAALPLLLAGGALLTGRRRPAATGPYVAS